MAEAGFSRVMAGMSGWQVVLPARRVIVTAMLAALGTGSLVGLLMGVVSTPGSGELTTQNAAGAPRSNAPVVPAAGTGSPTSASASDTQSPTTSVKTVTGTSQAPPAEFIEQPWTQRSMEFATLLDVQRNDQGVTVTLRKAKLLSGEAAHRYQRSKGTEQTDFAVVPGSGRRLTFPLRGDATLFGERALANHDNTERRQLNLDEFVNAAQEAIGHGDQPTVWVRHSNAIPGSPLIYLAEQYVSANPA